MSSSAKKHGRIGCKVKNKKKWSFLKNSFFFSRSLSNVPYYLTVRMFHVIHFLVGGRLEKKERNEWEEDGRNAGRCRIVEGKKGLGRRWKECWAV
jgi:hypothetical protein